MQRLSFVTAALTLIVVKVSTGLLSAQVDGQKAPKTDYSAGFAELERVIELEIRRKGLPSFSIAVADGETTLYSRAWGHEDRAREIAATPKTRYRAGSVSKLITAVLVMQEVEKGRLSLDEPVEKYLPGFAPVDEWKRPLTLRQILSHRSGMIREPAVGSYFDAGEPGLEATVKSLAGRRRVYAPQTKTKYSNAAVTVAGHITAKSAGLPFARLARERVLQPCGMTQSSFADDAGSREHLAKAFMWRIDGPQSPAPEFSLGTTPAGSLVATMEDLLGFARMIFRGGMGATDRVLDAKSIAGMSEPQFDPKGGYGIGFALSRFDGKPALRHGGAVYGFSTELFILPGENLAIAASTSLDVCNATVSRIVRHAARIVVAGRKNEKPPRLALAGPVDPGKARALAGLYGVGGQTLRLHERGGRLYVEQGTSFVELKRMDENLVVDGRQRVGGELTPADGGLILRGRFVPRLPDPEPAPAPAPLREYIGEYGEDHNVLYLLEEGGRLHALVEWFFRYPLTPVGPDTFAFPKSGLYDGERIVMRRDEAGVLTEAVMAGVVFTRRSVGTPAGETFRIRPEAPMSVLRPRALKARPPIEEGIKRVPDLVELHSLDRGIRYDIRYASTNNFMGSVFYDQALAFMQRPAAEAVVRVHRALAKKGYGLYIHDAYRPWYVTKMFWDATPASMKDFVADPSKGSRHNRGCAVDLTLYRIKTGEVVTMVGGYDEFTERSYPYYPGGTSRQRWHRELLRSAMQAEGFTVYEYEWWHFDFADWRSYPILNLEFSALGGQKK